MYILWPLKLFSLFLEQKGLLLPGLSHHPQLVVSAYADDIRLFVKALRNVDNFSVNLDIYQTHRHCLPAAKEGQTTGLC